MILATLESAEGLTKDKISMKNLACVVELKTKKQDVPNDIKGRKFIICHHVASTAHGSISLLIYFVTRSLK